MSGKNAVVLLSGGRDSVCLLDVAVELGCSARALAHSAARSRPPELLRTIRAQALFQRDRGVEAGSAVRPRAHRLRPHRLVVSREGAAGVGQPSVHESVGGEGQRGGDVRSTVPNWERAPTTG